MENHGPSARYFQKAEDGGQCEVTEMVQKRWQGRGGSHSSPEGEDQSEHVRQVKHTGLDIERAP